MQRVIERILNLLAFLLTVDRPVTADEIRHTVAGYDQDSEEAARRMFERDKDLLRQLGIPLQVQPTDAWEVEHGYVVDDYSLPELDLTDEERAALWLAASVVRIGGVAAGPDALFKLGGVSLPGSGEPLAADLGSHEDLVVAFAAVSDRRRLAFTYRQVRRLIDPYGLVHRRGHWYVVGGEDGHTKVFRLDRAGEVDIRGDAGAFDRPPGFVASAAIPEAPWEAGGEDLQATVRFDSEVAWWARRQLTGRTRIVEDDDGSLLATLPVANPEAFIGWVLSFDDKAVIVEPAELRRRLLTRVGAS